MDDRPVDHGEGQNDVRRQRSPRSRYVLLPAATFLAGLLLGGALVWVAQPGSSDGDSGSAGEGSPSASPSPSPTAVPSGSIVVPRACLRAAQSAEDLVNLGRDAATALANLDAAALQDVVDRMQALDQRVRADLRECRQPEAP